MKVWSRLYPCAIIANRRDSVMNDCRTHIRQVKVSLTDNKSVSIHYSRATTPLGGATGQLVFGG